MCVIFIHVVAEENGAIIPVSQTNFAKIVECTDQWIAGDGIQHSIAVDFINKCQKHVVLGSGTYSDSRTAGIIDQVHLHTCSKTKPYWPTDLSSTSTSTYYDADTGPSWACFGCMADNGYGYHRACFMKYTNKKIIAGSLRRVQKKGDSIETKESIAAATPELRPKRMCLTKDTTKSREAYRKEFFPELCLICNKEQYIRESHSRKRKKERLVQCETFNAADLLKTAATKKAIFNFCQELMV